MRTQWKIVALEETGFWNEDIVARAGRLFGIYLFDANRNTYCCELRPSYELYFIETVNERDHSDRMYDEILEADLYTEWVTYYHCGSIDRVDAKMFVSFPHHDIEYETDAEWKEDREEMLEFLRGNQHTPPGVPYLPDFEEA